MKTQHAPGLALRVPTIAIALTALMSVSTVLFGDTEERMIYTFGTINASDVAVDGAGNVYGTDDSNHRIWRINTQGVITTFAGTTGVGGYGGDGGPATAARLNGPAGMAMDGAGNVYVADYRNYRIRRIDTQGVITTFAGTGEWGDGGDGGPATEAWFRYPGGVAVDGAGNVYVGDRHRIRRIDTQGVITAFAGTGEWGYSGDGGPATEAEFYDITGVDVDGAGNVYVTDRHRIRRIDTQGVITTFAGTGEWGYSGDGGPATEAEFYDITGVDVDGAGNVYVTDRHRIRRIDTQGVITTFAGTGEWGYSGDGGPATEARLNDPDGLAVDGAGNVYVADRGNEVVRVILAPGARTPFTQWFPHFANGDSTVSDLVLVNVDTKRITPVVRFYDPNGEQISADSLVDITGDLELASDGALSVTGGIPPLGERTISTHGRGASTTGSVRVASNGPVGGFLRFNSMVVGVAGVGAAEPVNDAIFPARRKKGGINTGAALRNLESDAITVTCRLMQGGEVRNNAKVELAGDGKLARFINELFPDADTSDFTGSVRCTAPEKLMFAGVTLEMDFVNRIFTTLPLVPIVSAELLGDIEARHVYIFAGRGGNDGYSGDGGPAAEAKFDSPSGVAVDGEGNVYVADYGNHRIRRIDTHGVITTFAGSGSTGIFSGGLSGDGGPATEAQLNYPRGVAVDAAGNVYVADSANDRIRRIDTQGVITTFAGSGEYGGQGGDGGPATEAQLNDPRGVAVDAAGNVYVGDLNNHRIRRIDTRGVITTFAGTGRGSYGGDGGPATLARLYYPKGVAVDAVGNVYVADSGNDRIRRIDTQGVITTFAGTGKEGYAGDGGPATEAQLSNPTGVAVDAVGNVYVADSSNRRIRHIDTHGMITTLGTGPARIPVYLSGFLGYVAVDGEGNLYISTGNRIQVIKPPGERIVTKEFPHFANGGSTVSDLVLVNVDTKAVTPVVRFYGSNGELIPADSVVDVTGDMELAADGSLFFTAGIPPLGERTISTHGRGALTSGSVRVVSDGTIGGILRFDIMAVGVAGVGAAEPVRGEMVFPARRKEGGINTGVALRNLHGDAIDLSCSLMVDGELLKTEVLKLAFRKQSARFINEIFPTVNTSNFSGTVHCTSSGYRGGTFAGVALEMDIGNRIFTTLPLVPRTVPVEVRTIWKR